MTTTLFNQASWIGYLRTLNDHLSLSLDYHWDNHTDVVLSCSIYVFKHTCNQSVASSKKGQCMNNVEIVTSATLVYTTLTKFSMNYLVMCKVYTDVGGIK